MYSIFAYNNLGEATGATVFAPGCQYEYPDDYLIDRQGGRRCWFGRNEGVINFELASKANVDIIALMNTNITTAATVTAKAGRFLNVDISNLDLSSPDHSFTTGLSIDTTSTTASISSTSDDLRYVPDSYLVIAEDSSGWKYIGWAANATATNIAIYCDPGLTTRGWYGTQGGFASGNLSMVKAYFCFLGDQITGNFLSTTRTDEVHGVFDGVDTTFAAGAPAIVDNPDTGEGGFVIQVAAAKTNYAEDSWDLDNTSVWGQYEGAIDSTPVAAPDGTADHAYGFVASAASDVHTVFYSDYISCSEGNYISITADVKAGNKDYFWWYLEFYSSGHVGEDTYTGSPIAITSGIAVGNGYYRHTITYLVPDTTPNTVEFNFAIGPANSGSTTFSGDGSTINIYPTNIQAEIGLPTPYITTDGGTDTRSAEELTLALSTAQQAIFTSGDGTMIADVVFNTAYNGGYTSSALGIIGVQDAVAGILAADKDGPELQSYDGTTTATLSFAWAADTQYRTAIWWDADDTFGPGYDSTWDAGESYDGSFSPTSNMYFGHTPQGTIYFQAVSFFEFKSAAANPNAVTFADTYSLNIGDRNQWYHFANSEGDYQYWTIEISDSSLSYIKIGQAFVGPCIQLSTIPNPRAVRGLSTISIGGQSLFGVGPSYLLTEESRNPGYAWTLSNADWQNIMTMFRAVGGAVPFLLIPNESETSYLAYYCKFPPNLQEQYQVVWNTTIEWMQIGIQFIEEPMPLEG